jgi:acyl-CoA thioester hydrolase
MSGADVVPDGWFRHDLAVRFRDLDPMGHAHHTLPLIYLEEARAEFWRRLKGRSDLDSIDYVMAEVTLRFHARIVYPSTVHVQLAVSRVGERSFTTVFEIRDDAETLLSSGSAVQVAFDYAAGSSKPIDLADRGILSAWCAASDRRQNSSARPAETIPISPPST